MFNIVRDVQEKSSVVATITCCLPLTVKGDLIAVMDIVIKVLCFRKNSNVSFKGKTQSEFSAHLL